MGLNILKEKHSQKKIIQIILPTCLILGIGIKFCFIFQESLWPDEALYLFMGRNLAADLANLTGINGKLFYHNPPLLMYLLSLVYRLNQMAGLGFEPAARLLIVLTAAGISVVTYYIGKKHADPVTGLIAATLVAVCPLTNWIGVRVLTDIPVTFFIYLAVCFLMYDRKTAFFLAAACAVATKYTALPLFFLPLLIKLKPRNWALLYAALFLILLLFVLNKELVPEPSGWLALLYHFFKIPNFSHTIKEMTFFPSISLLGLAVIGFIFAIREKKYDALFHWVILFGLFRFFLPWFMFRMSRYSLPVFPGIYLFAALGFFKSLQIIASKWPQYIRSVAVCCGAALSFLLFFQAVKSVDLLTHTQKTFIGFEAACDFLKTLPGKEMSVATASPRQMKYFGSEFEVHDIQKKYGTEDFLEMINKRRIKFICIDLWSPHLPRWCRNYDYRSSGFELIYQSQYIYIFRPPRLDAP
ncbi:MAG: hypothetical protein D3913_10275 [Candidatus Electrothrix sp. LOE1_4_5]|nr:hypothetical protein [Candidatus Electrothrix gigas]